MSPARHRSLLRNRFNWHAHRGACEGLATCTDHPRWHVWQADDGWAITSPLRPDTLRVDYEEVFPTWDEAVWEATRLARKTAAPPALLPCAPGYHFIVFPDGTMFETKELTA